MPPAWRRDSLEGEVGLLSDSSDGELPFWNKFTGSEILFFHFTSSLKGDGELFRPAADVGLEESVTWGGMEERIPPVKWFSREILGVSTLESSCTDFAQRAISSNSREVRSHIIVLIVVDRDLEGDGTEKAPSQRSDPLISLSKSNSW